MINTRMKSYQFLLEYRRDKTAVNLGDKLVTAMSRDPSLVAIFKGKSLADIKDRLVSDPGFQEEVFSRFEAGDPTRNKQYTQWLINFYIRNAGNIRLEDISSTIKDLLDVYAVGITKNLVPAEYRDINRIRDIDTLEAVVRQVNSAINKATTTQPQVKQNAEEVFNDSQIRIIKPLDEAAACYYGQGTRWCTAAKNNNQFDYYNSQSPLYIIIPKTPSHPGEKYQLHSSQFMDEKDSPVNIDNLVKKYPSILTSTEIQATLVRQDGRAIRHIRNPSEAVQRLAVKQNGWAIRYIPNPSEEMQRLAVKQDGWAIHYIPNPSEEVQRLAIQQDGDAIRHIRNPSEEVQRLAVQRNGRAIQYIPNPSEEVQRIARGKDPGVKESMDLTDSTNTITRLRNLAGIK